MGEDQVIAVNRKAFHDYLIQERMECGLVLTGTEIKSIRLGGVSLQQAYAGPDNGALWLFDVHIARYEAGGRYNHDPKRPRKLLLHKREMNRVMGSVARKGYTLVPLRLYLKHGLAKVELGLAQSKKQYDKRKALAEKDARRETERALKTKVGRR
ncbi:MAG: SsrA-binding protein SmpB [Chloroflexota bacterium]|nr:SsrA-binding protein SmpB [Chloroflexota bacterium]